MSNIKSRLDVVIEGVEDKVDGPMTLVLSVNEAQGLYDELENVLKTPVENQPE